MNRIGRDYSHHNPDAEVQFGVDLAKGVRFEALKVSQGAGFVDPDFLARIRRARTVAFDALVLYHFFDPSVPAEAQAVHFVNTLQSVLPLHPNERIALDLEQSGDAWKALSPEQSADAVEAWFAKVKELLALHDDHCYVYGSLGWLKGQFGKFLSRLTNWKFWWAKYIEGSSAPFDPGSPAPWKTWHIHQFAQYGGPNKDLDLDQSNGDIAL